jgi:thymidylate synthase ThyX
MPYKANILLDSIGENGKRITTWELSYPRFVHAELMTHRVFSRNSSSSRAIPVNKMLERIVNDPATPVWWGKNQAGMQAREELTGEVLEAVQKIWLEARDLMVQKASELNNLGLHKQIANRLTEPWMFITVILTATEFDNWFKLRCHPDAQPEIKYLADMMFSAYQANCPQKLHYGEWHIPMLKAEESELSIDEKLAISTARCARVSYMNHDGTNSNVEKDKGLHDSLASSGHWSPFEHCAQNVTQGDYKGSNFFGWNQYRKRFSGEDGVPEKPIETKRSNICEDVIMAYEKCQ